MDWRVRSFTQLLVLGCLLAIIDCGTAEQRVVCYYTNWSVYRPGTAKFSPQNINPYLCTHLIYAFGGFTKDNALKPFDKYQDIEKGGYAKFTGLKTYNKNLKTMLAIGGWNEASSRFSPMVADPDRRKEFVRNTVKFLRQNHFDGLDLDWEYPAFRDGGKPRDRDNYASLVQELREEYERESSKTGRPRLLLSMAVPAGIEYIEKGYDIPKLNKYLDFINLLSYDYHSSFEPAVNHHSPLYPLEEDNEYNFDTELTVDYTIKYLLESGASADKIVLGIPTYGRSYTLFNEEATDLGSPADGPGEEGDATREKGYLAYYEICESLMNSDEWEIVTPNPNAMGPYAFKGNQWVGYDDENIVRLKAQYVTENGLGGIMFWSIDNDDFRGKCHDRAYPLIEAAKEAMLVGSERTSVREKSTRPTKTTKQGSNYIGRKIGTGRRTTTEASAITRQSSSRKRVNSSKFRNRGKPRVSSEEEEEEAEETRVQFNGRNRGQFFNTEEDEDYSNNAKIGTNIVRSLEYGDDNAEEVSRQSSGNRVRSGQGRKRKPENSRRRSTTASSIRESIEEEVNVKKITTPEPPTTPDPGTDFKCEEEGFFSHPRDCKKYFWCLDAGPGGLGIVAHHFTCPAGLVFNKAADSCDYPRNVVCPKTKTVDSPTTRAPIVAATSRTTRINSTNRRTTTSTTTEPAEYSEEYEYYDDEDDEVVKSDKRYENSTPLITTTARTLQYKTIQRGRPTTDASTTTTTTVAPTITTEIPSKTVTFRNYQSIPSRSSSIPPIASLDEAEEDPKVLKELIELIKKAGGIEELEKQLHLQSKGGESILQTGSVTDAANSTPSTISKSLYERVLNRQVTNRGSAFFRRTTPSPVTTTKEATEILDPQPSITQRSRPAFRNGPGRAQFEGLDDLPEVKSLRREKPQYTTINRNRSSSTQPPNENDDEINDEDADEPTVEEKPIIDEPETTPRTQKNTSGYVDIRRGRTTTTRSNVVEEEEEEDEEKGEKDEESVYTQRRRPAILDNEANNDDDDDDNEDSKNVQTTTETPVSRRRSQFPSQDQTASTTSRYITIQRVRSTTQATTAEKKEQEEEEEERTSPKDDEKVIETTTKSSTESTPTTTSEERADEKIPISETTVSIEASATEQSVLQTTIAVNQPITTTQSSNFVPTDFPVETVDPIATLLPAITVKTTEEYVTTSAAPLPAVVPIASTEEPNLDEQHVTKGVIATVAQPRPFGFQRRTRPTTTSTTLTPTQETTTTTTTTTTVSSDTGRVKVSSETVRLPTLKELIGYKTIVAHDYTTTTPITLTVKNLLDDDNDINNNEPDKHLAATITPAFESEKLTPEQVQITNTTTSTIAYKKITKEVEITDETQSKEHSTLETYGNNKDYVGGIEANGVSEISEESSISTESSIPSTIPITIFKQNRITPGRRKTKLVRIPVRILESDRPLTDVVLEVPEYKVDSILKSLLRVEILKQDDVTTSTTKIPEAVNRRNQRTRHRNGYRNRGDLINEKESNELLNRDANTNFISDQNTFTTTTPRVSTIRGSRLSPRSRSRGNRGFYVTKSIASTTSYETMTSTVPPLVTESNNALDEQLSTIPAQLSTLKENTSTVATTSVTETSEFYTTQEESTPQDTWHSTITTSLENFNNIMAVNDDVDNPMLVAQKTTTTPSDPVSTVYLSTTETVNNVESTTESASTVYEEDSYSSTSGEEEFALNSTEGYDETYTGATAEPELSTEDSRTTSSVTQISTTVEDLEYFIKVDPPLPDIQKTTIWRGANSVKEIGSSGIEAFAKINPPLPDIQKTTIWRKDNSVKEIGASGIGATSFDIYDEADRTKIQKTTGSNYEGTSEAISTVDPDILRTTSNWQSNTVAETSTSRSGSTIFTTDFEVGTETGTTDFQKTTVSDFGGTTEAVNTVTPDISQTTINHDTYSTTDSSTSKSETTKLNTEFDSYTKITATPEFQTTTTSDSGETTTEINEDIYSTTESSTLRSGTTKLNTEFNFYNEASTPDFKKTTLPDDSEITTEISETVTPDLLRTTINENLYPTVESSSSKLGATTSNTEFNFYTEVSTPDFQKTTISDIEVTSDGTKFLDSETSTVDFKTEVDSSTETTSVGTTSYFRRPTIDDGLNSTPEPTTFSSNESHQADNFVPQSETTEESASTTTSSSSQANFETTTFLNAQSEASTFDFTAPNTISTISYSSITTQVPSATVADKMQTLNAPIVETEKKEIGTLSRTDSESTSLPTTNAFVETTAASTTTKRDEEVTQRLSTDENETEVRRPLLATRYSDSELVRQGFYRSPSAIPGKKTWRKRVIKKRIYGVRSPHVETVSGNENSTGTVKLNPTGRFNGTNKPGKRFVRRRIINRTTGTFIDETVKGNTRVKVAQNKTLNISRTNQTPEFVQNTTTDLPNERNTVEKNLPKRRRVFYRRRPTNNRKNTRNNSIEANISSQNTSASNDVQSSSVSSTNLSDRRRITLERFRSRGTGLAKRSAISSSPSSQSILATDIRQLRSIESAAEDNLPRRNTGGQYLTDATVDNLASRSEIYDTVAIHERRELPRSESISEAQLELEPSLMSEDDQADEGEIKLFKTRPSSPRLPGTLLRQGRPSSSSTSIPDNEIVTTISPSTKPPNSVALRRRFRPVQRATTATNNVATTSQPASESGETLKSGGNEAASESLDQTGHAQEVDVTVAARDSSSPAPPTVTGRPLFRTAIRRRISSTEAPQVTVPTTVPTIVRQRQRPKPFEKVSANTPTRPRRPAIIDYDYYEDSEERVIGKPKLSGKISVSSGGSIRCLDQGNFPHPTSCKKFITCARMVNGQVIGTEYTCPKRLSFDPVGGICNWSAGLGCKE